LEARLGSFENLNEPSLNKILSLGKQLNKHEQPKARLGQLD